MIALAAMICVFHCAKPQPANAIENDTGQDVRVEVTYRGSDNRTVAVAAPGGKIALQAPVEQIEGIRYSYADHTCALTHEQVIGANRPGGKAAVVKLEPCG